MFRVKLWALAAALPALALAADPEMMNLVMPDASLVVEVNLARIMASPVGSAMGDAVRQGISSQMQVGLAKAQPQLQEQLAGLANIDWSHDLQDIVIAGGTGKSSPALVIVRTSLDRARIQAIKAFSGDITEYQGVPMLVSTKPGNGVIAFLENSIVVIGQLPDVQSAIRRRGQHAALPPALAAQVEKYNGYDVWVATNGLLPGPLNVPAAGSPPPAAQAAARYLEKIAGFNAGLRFSPDLELSADIQARTQKDAAEMSEGLRFLVSSIKTQARSSGQAVSGLEDLKYQLEGRRILLSLHVPEDQIRAGIQKARVAQSVQKAPAPNAPPPPAPSNGMPPPPPGTIRVQSSEGTVLIPVQK